MSNAFHWQGSPSIFVSENQDLKRRLEAKERKQTRAERNREIVSMFEGGMTRKELGEKYGLLPHTISVIIRENKVSH